MERIVEWRDEVEKKPLKWAVEIEKMIYEWYSMDVVVWSNFLHSIYVEK